MKNFAIGILGLALAGATPVSLAQSNDHTAHHAAPAAASAQAMSDGEVRKVDKETGKITLRHGPIPNIGMPNMTMVFGVRDPAFLDRVKAGDKVKFTADKVDGVYTVTDIDVVK